MDAFIFRTAIPFGYLPFWGGVALLAVAALATVGRGIRSRRTAHVIGGGVVVAGLVALAAVNVAAEKKLDFNPLIRDETELAGQWRDGRSVLDLRADGTFTCRGGSECAGLGPAGTWSWRDFQITFCAPTGVTVVRRIIRYDGEVRLANWPADSDSWNGQFSFRRRSAG
jgi:hypothetical protein